MTQPHIRQLLLTARSPLLRNRKFRFKPVDRQIRLQNPVRPRYNLIFHNIRHHHLDNTAPRRFRWIAVTVQRTNIRTCTPSAISNINPFRLFNHLIIIRIKIWHKARPLALLRVTTIPIKPTIPINPDSIEVEINRNLKIRLLELNLRATPGRQRTHPGSNHHPTHQ